MKKSDKLTDFFAEAEKTLSEESVQEAYADAQKEIFKIRLSELRNQFGIKQTEMKGFSQPAISQLEARKDMKISTLVDYVHSLGLKIEIKVTENKRGKRKEIMLVDS